MDWKELFRKTGIVVFVGAIFVGVVGFVLAITEADNERRRKCSTWHFIAENEQHLIYKSECDYIMTMPKPKS